MSSLYSRGIGVEEAPMEGETLLYHKDTKRFCRLNSTAAFVWECLEQPRSVDDLAAAICEAFDGVEPSQARADVKGAVEELVELSILVKT